MFLVQLFSHKSLCVCEGVGRGCSDQDLVTLVSNMMERSVDLWLAGWHSQSPDKFSSLSKLSSFG